MAQNTKIEWCHHTVNLWHGCTKVHAGCDHCYAEKMSKRWGHDIWGNDKPRLEIKSCWDDLIKYQKLAAVAGEIHRVFIGSMMDIFEKPMPLIDNGDEMILDTGCLRSMLFDGITLESFPNLMFLFLTKRPGNINKDIPGSWKETPPPNVMFGTSVSDQKTANKLIPQLLNVKGKHFISIEPQLGSVNIMPFAAGIDWVIQGGESGPHKRPFNIGWAYQIKQQCITKGIPYFFKQIDKVQPIPDDLMIREFPVL